MWFRHRTPPFGDDTWREVIGALPILRGLGARQTRRLRQLTTEFLRRKSIEPVQGQVLDERARVRIAAQACLPILGLGMAAYDGWTSLVVYPGGFVSRGHTVDEAGVAHEWEEARAGESWWRGPVILSWEDVRASGRGTGYNVIIHELAHKLDMLNGDANGFPPLHREMRATTWQRVFSTAFDDLNARLDRGDRGALDAYAAETPGEFFAVASEYFFELPQALAAAYPGVYEQLRAYYRQDPAARPHMERQ